ncbi:MAG: hypothetical protein ACLQVK_22135 [Acidimicrobiales bacterium]
MTSLTAGRFAIFSLLIVVLLGVPEGGVVIGATRSGATTAPRSVPVLPTCKKIGYNGPAPCVPISFGSFGNYYPPGKTNPNDALPLDPFSGTVTANPSVLTMTRCPGYPRSWGLWCTQAFTITVSPHAAGKLISVSGGADDWSGCTVSCPQYTLLASQRATRSGGPGTAVPFCPPTPSSPLCTSLTSQPMRIFNSLCGAATASGLCTAPLIDPEIIVGGVGLERNIPPYGETRGAGTFYAQVTITSGASPGGSQPVQRSRRALLVEVTPTPGTLRLALKGDALVPRSIAVKVSVTNTGKTPVHSARLQGKLIVGYLGRTPAVPEIPIRPAGPPVPAALGTIPPGKTVSGTYKLLAKGDGDYSLQALVVGSAPGGGRIAGTGTGELHVSSPVLLLSTGYSGGASLPGMHGLIIAGTPFTIPLSLENLSYVHKIVVRPFSAALAGNAFGGQVVLGDGNVSALDPAAIPVPPEFLTLDPRQTLKAEVVVYTTQSQGILQNAGKQGVGGTRANVSIPTPAATYVADDGSAGAAVAGNDVGVNGDTTYVVGIDDSDLYTPQVYKDWLTGNYTGDTLTGAAFFSAGLVNGAANFFSGMVHGIPDLPLLVGKGLVAIPPALYDLTEFEVDLWKTAQTDPVAKLALSNAMTATAYAMYKNAEGFAGSSFGKEIVAAEDAYFTNLSNLWGRDWGAAVEQVGETTGELVAPVAGPKLATWFVRSMGPAVLARSGPVLRAFAAQQNALVTAFGQELATRYPRFASALDAISALHDAPPGTAFTDTQIRQLYGLTQNQVSFLRSFAKSQDLLIVVRSRAVESIAWLNGQVVNGVKWAAAVLKPEAIKLKNVSFEDWQYLGYKQSDIGRVVISQHELPAVAQVEAKMAANGLTRGSTDWNDILDRLATRQGEFTAPASKGKVLGMIQDAEKGEITMNFNLAGNSVDPSAITATETTYPFRLANELNQAIPKGQLASYKGSMIPEFFVNGEWRCVTGDVDFLQVTSGNGAPLGDVRRAAVYSALSKSPVGFMHGESATWTLGSAFSFPEKVNEFVRAGTALQFAPDEGARAVKFAAAQFLDKGNYVIEWEGGALNPTGAVTPR